MIRIYKVKCICIVKGEKFIRGNYYFAVKNDRGIKVYDNVNKRWIQFSLPTPGRFKSNNPDFNYYFKDFNLFNDLENKKELNKFIERVDNNE